MTNDDEREKSDDGSVRKNTRLNDKSVNWQREKSRSTRLSFVSPRKMLFELNGLDAGDLSMENVKKLAEACARILEFNQEQEIRPDDGLPTPPPAPTTPQPTSVAPTRVTTTWAKCMATKRDGKPCTKNAEEGFLTCGYQSHRAQEEELRKKTVPRVDSTASFEIPPRTLNRRLRNRPWHRARAPVSNRPVSPQKNANGVMNWSTTWPPEVSRRSQGRGGDTALGPGSLIPGALLVRIPCTRLIRPKTEWFCPLLLRRMKPNKPVSDPKINSCGHLLRPPFLEIRVTT